MTWFALTTFCYKAKRTSPSHSIKVNNNAICEFHSNLISNIIHIFKYISTVWQLHDWTFSISSRQNLSAESFILTKHLHFVYRLIWIKLTYNLLLIGWIAKCTESMTSRERRNQFIHVFTRLSNNPSRHLVWLFVVIESF